MTRKEVKESILLIICIFIFLELLGFLLKPLHLEGVLQMFLVFSALYFLIQKRQKLKIPLKSPLNLRQQMKVGWFAIISILYYLLLIQSAIRTSPEMFPYALKVTLAVALTEEYIFRGLLLSKIFKNGYRSVKQIREGVIFSGVLFGAVHLFNMMDGQSLEATIFQACFAGVSGLFYAIVMLRTKSIGWAVLLHFLKDFAIFLRTKDLHQTLPLGMNWAILLGMCLFFLIQVFFALYLLRPQKAQELLDDQDIQPDIDLRMIADEKC